MRKFTLPYGLEELTVELPDEGYQGTFLPSKGSRAGSAQELLACALQNPVGCPRLEQLAQCKKKVVIVTSDLTRPCPNAVILPPLVSALNAAGVMDEQISIVIALGLHRKMTEAELEQSIGEDLFSRIRVLNHDINDVVPFGVTSRGTPVEIFRVVAEADLKICVGSVELHYFAGYSGGAKAIMPGVASKRAIKANHSHMIQKTAAATYLEGNPVREDLEEAVSMIGVDFLLNVIVDEKGRIIHAKAGHVRGAHRELCRILEGESLVPLPNRLDVAIVSAGGYPKDIDLYQAQKALDNCAGVVRPGGAMILLAECGEGYGNETFAKWMRAGKSPQELLEKLKCSFILGGHKAAAIAKVAMAIELYLVTGATLRDETITGLSITSWEKALSQICCKYGPAFSYAVFPLGASTLPRAVSKKV